MIEYLFHNGCTHAFTVGFDDGQYDERLIAILNRYGIRGTFFLNSSLMQGNGACDSARIREVYSGHEVACHGVGHRVLNYLPITEIYEEVYRDRAYLEARTAAPAVGLSYPCNGYSDAVIAAVRSMGIRYARTTESTGDYKLPADFMRWNPTCHYKNAQQYVDGFLRSIDGWLGYPRLLYIWGHAHELQARDDWSMWEELCRRVGNNPAVWYTDNYSLYRYVTALRSLIVSADRKTVYNPSGIPVWISSYGKKYPVPSNGFVRLEENDE